jgi:hypothetical protein
MVGESLADHHHSSPFKVEPFSDGNLHLPRPFKHIIGAVLASLNILDEPYADSGGLVRITEGTVIRSCMDRLKYC